MGRTKGRGTARYALWKGDQCIAIGTALQLAEKLGVTTKTIKWYSSPAAKRRDTGNHTVAERI